ncbi:MAG: type III-A CRISPR-associated RAMP protein Csm3 [Bacteroidales bacterium]|nr:type III-A CRISPR-associated RAMP protein Csm3 [Bacteroidales bacterium]
MKLLKTMTFEGVIKVVTGLHIGGSTEQIEIGGIDNPVIKLVYFNEPYIPGSSLKGKMRSSLEKKYNRFGEVRKGLTPCNCGKEDCLVCRVFGAHMNTRHKLGSTRILVRDAYYNSATKEKIKESLSKGEAYLEVKTENIINRSGGQAEHPRQLERVPAGAEFDFEISLQIYDKDNEGAMVDFVKEGLKLVEESYLGGYGSRGSGQIEFVDLKLDGQSFAL